MQKLSSFRLIIVGVASLLMTINAYAFKVESRWNTQFKKEVVLNCEGNSLECYSICANEKECVVYEKPCKDCIGTSVFMTHLFENIGKSYVNSMYEVSLYEFFKYLNRGLFSTVSSRSIFNHVSKFDNPELKERFMSLCEDSTEYPNVFIGVEPVTRTPNSVMYVSCLDNNKNTRVFKMETYGGVDITPYADDLL